MVRRAGLVAVLVLLVAALGLSSAGAQEDRSGELQRRLSDAQRDIDTLRAELAVLQDMSLEQARRFDQERRRLLERVEGLEARLSPDAPRVTTRLRATPLAEACARLDERVVVEGAPAGVTVTLNLREVALPQALELLCDNAYGADGEPLALHVRREGERRVVAPPR